MMKTRPSVCLLLKYCNINSYLRLSRNRSQWPESRQTLLCSDHHRLGSQFMSMVRSLEDDNLFIVPFSSGFRWSVYRSATIIILCNSVGSTADLERFSTINHYGATPLGVHRTPPRLYYADVVCLVQAEALFLLLLSLNDDLYESDRR